MGLIFEMGFVKNSADVKSKKKKSHVKSSKTKNAVKYVTLFIRMYKVH